MMSGGNMKNGNHNISCEYFADIVSYLYNETTEAERRRFESHLAGCGPCTDEFAAVSDARYSIYEWRKEEFANLPTPEIVIPFAKQPAAVRNEKESVIAYLGKLISGRGWSSAVPVFAAVLVCVGLAFAFFMFWNRGNVPSVAESKDIPVKKDFNSSAPSNDKRDEIAARNGKVTPTDDIRPEKERDETAIETPNRSTKAGARKPDVVPVKIARHIDPNRDTAVAKPVRELQRQKAPVLSRYDEDDDKSLRLSDLFDEGGS